MVNDFAATRLAICEKCPLYIINENGVPTCNSNLRMNPKTGATSKLPRPGFIKGCGCALQKKIKYIGNHCICEK